MANFARVIDGIAIDVSADPSAEFHPSIAEEFVKAPATVTRGWVLKGTKWSAPVVHVDKVEPDAEAPAKE